MSFPVIIREKSTSDQILVLIPVEFPFQQISVKDLIVEKVKQEVIKKNDYYQKTTISEREQRLNQNIIAIQQDNTIKTSTGNVASSLSDALPDLNEEIEKALDSFLRNGFFVLIEGEQYTELKQQILWRQQLDIVFLKLVPLVGG